MLPKAIAFSKRTTITIARDPGDTSIVVADRAVFPTLAGEDYTYAVLSNDPYYVNDDANYETVKITAIEVGGGTTGTLTVQRNIESSTGAAQEWAEGATIACLITAKGWNDIKEYMIEYTAGTALTLDDKEFNVDIGTEDGEVAAGDHDHGNVTTDGKIGSAEHIPIITGASGVMQAGSFGTAANTFCAGDDGRFAEKLDVAGGTMTGAINYDGQKAQKPVIESYTETVLSTSGTGNTTFNLANANVFEHTVNANTTTTFKVTGQKAQALSITVMVHQHEDGPTIIWDFDDGDGGGDILWPGDAIPEIDDDVTAIFTFVTIDSGVTWYGHLVGQDYGDGVA